MTQTIQETMLRSYEITLNGFYGGTSDTDDLVKWIAAPSDDAIRAFIQKHGLRSHVQGGPEYMEGRDGSTFDDGIDLIVGPKGDVERWSRSLNMNWRRKWTEEAWPEPFNEDNYDSIDAADKAHRKLCKRFGRRRKRN